VGADNGWRRPARLVGYSKFPEMRRGHGRDVGYRQSHAAAGRHASRAAPGQPLDEPLHSVRTGHVLPDTQCGFRLVDLRVWSELALTAERFEAESEILFRFLQARQRVEFVPIQVIYGNERSKINPAADTIRWFRWWRGIRRREQARLC
jgi:hypothetical protein